MTYPNLGFAPPQTSRPAKKKNRGPVAELAAAIAASPMEKRGHVRGIERRLARRMLLAMGCPSIRMVLWNGEEIALPDDAPVARVVFHDRPTFWKVLLDPDLQFGDAYGDGRLEVEGDLVRMLESVYRARSQSGRSGGFVPDSVLRWLHRARANTISASRENIHHHYDLGEDFYQLWLDDEMVYSGAYFSSPDISLEEAQQAKLHYVCRKLRLQPGETVVEVGGGWGALALLMARDYGVHVKSFNISRSQILYARLRAQAEDLDSRVEFIEDDYRNISGRFDALVSLGMLEHVGRSNYREFGRMMDRCLSPNGRGLIQSIGQDRSDPISTWIEQRVFPGAYPPTIREMSDLFEFSGFSVLDVENLRLHYAETLRHWLKRFETTAETVEVMFDEHFVRLWRLYLAGSCAAFRAGSLQLYQLLFARSGANNVPMTRAAWYG